MGAVRKEQSSPATQLLLDESLQPMLVVQTETLAFLEANQAAIDKYGYSREEFQRMRLTDLVSPEDRNRLSELMRKEHIGSSNFGDMRHVLKNGQSVEID